MSASRLMRRKNQPTRQPKTKYTRAFGATPSEIARLLNLSTHTTTKFFILDHLPPEYKNVFLELLEMNEGEFKRRQKKFLSEEAQCSKRVKSTGGRYVSSAISSVEAKKLVLRFFRKHPFATVRD